MGATMIRTQIQLTQEQSASVKELSAAAGISISDFVRRCVDAYVASRDETTRARRVKRALAAVGKFRSGESDVSERHDEYYVESILQRLK